MAGFERLAADELSPSLVEVVAQRLRREILSGRLEPGQRIVEEQVTRELGTSRAPLREALRLLAQQGLVEHLPRRGVRVATLSGGDVAELFDLRAVLERHAVRLAVPVAPAALADVRAELDAMRRGAESGDAFDYAEAHRRYHRAVVALAGRHQLLLAFEPVLLKLQLAMATNLRRETQQASAAGGVRRHETLLAALGSADVETVLAALAAHGEQAYLR